MSLPPLDLAALSVDDKRLCTLLLAELQKFVMECDRQALGTEASSMALGFAYKTVFDELADRIEVMWRARLPQPPWEGGTSAS